MTGRPGSGRHESDAAEQMLQIEGSRGQKNPKVRPTQARRAVPQKKLTEKG